MSIMWRLDEPEIIINGNEFSVAWAKAVNPFKNPGAETVKATPGLPVIKPAPAAASTAASSRLNP